MAGAKIRTAVIPDDPMKGILPEYVEVIEAELLDAKKNFRVAQRVNSG